MPRPAIGPRAMTEAERQARRRQRMNEMTAALVAIRDQARTITEARAIARDALPAKPKVLDGA